MACCEADENHVDFLFGLARNGRLQKIIGKQMQEARLLHAETGKAARVFTEFDTRPARAGRGRAALSPRLRSGRAGKREKARRLIRPASPSALAAHWPKGI